MNEEKIRSLLLLKKVPNLGDSSIKKLINAVGSPQAVLAEKPVNLLKITGIGSHKIKGLSDKQHAVLADKELDFIFKNKVNVTCYDDPDYPSRLKHCVDGPVLLFSRGNIDLSNPKVISIVGTRKVTNYGVQFCENLIEQLAPLQPVIVSGFAYGVDITAHKAAIRHSLQTIGCLAHGLNQIYPKSHARYMSDVEKNGGFFTDFWSSDTFDRKNFLGRNRIIAGLSEATLVIESADKGGSLVTADIAHSYDREVFAVPGRATDTLSKGCNTLIKTQKAHMLTNAADIIYMLGWDVSENKKQTVQKQLFVELNTEEKHIYNFLKEAGKESLDIIALHCSIPTFKVASLLLTMELKGVIRPLPGKQFEIV